MRYARIVLCDAWVIIYASRIPMLKAIVGNDAFRNLLVSYERKIFGCNTLSVADMVRMERNDLCNFGKVCGLCLLLSSVSVLTDGLVTSRSVAKNRRFRSSQIFWMGKLYGPVDGDIAGAALKHRYAI